jgi:integrase
VKIANFTVGQLLEEWYLIESPGWSSPTSRRNTRSEINARLLPRWKDVLIKNVQVKDIESWYRVLRTTPVFHGGKCLSTASINKYHSTLRQAFNSAIRWGWISENPFSKARPPRPDTKEVIPPTLPEVLLLLDSAMQNYPDIGLALHLSATTGARRGEIVALQWSQINFDTGVMRIKYSVALNENHQPEIKRPKNNHARNNKLGERTLSLLKVHRKRCEENAKIAGARITDESFLFSLDIDGARPMSPDYYSRQFRRIRGMNNLEKIKLHDLRHYNASMMFEQGVDLVTVAGRLGHRDARTTLAVYAHFLEAPDLRAAELIELHFQN